MGILGNIFGNSAPKAVQISFREAEAFLEKELAQKKEKLLNESAKKISEIRHFLREAKSALEEFEKAEHLARGGRIDRIVKTAKSNALAQTASLLEKLSPPNSEDLAEINTYCSEAILALNQAGQFGKSVAYAGISFREEIKALGTHLKQLSSEFVSLKKLLDENSEVFVLPALKEKLIEFNSIQARMEQIAKNIPVMEKVLESVSLKKSRAKSDLKELSNGPEFKKVAELGGEKAVLLREKQDSKTKILDIFARVEKPLHRLDKAGSAGKIVLDRKQAAFLHNLLQNPFRALKLDPKAELLKEVLLEAKKAIESGLIELKEKEKEKKLDVLQELLSFDFFGENFWRFNRIDSEIFAIERELNENPALKKESALVSSLKQFEAEWLEAKNAVDSGKTELESLGSSINGKRKEIASLLSKATGKEVSFKG